MKENKKLRTVQSHDILIDEAYLNWVHDIKQRFQSAQIKAAVKVNSEQLLFNWQLGRELVERKAEETWGKGIVEQLSLDLQAAFPGIKGFSARNLWNMKKWYLFYTTADDIEDEIKLTEILLNVQPQKLQQVATEKKEPMNKKLQQVVAEISFPTFFSYVPWGHYVMIITRCRSMREALL